MRVIETGIAGVLVLDLDRLPDERGFFARTWDAAVLKALGYDARVAECSIAFNDVAGTLRGLHIQVDPFAEAKTVRCTAGAIWDVAVDLRIGSPTLHHWYGIELTAANRRSLFVPPGCAHGYLTLAPSTEVTYAISVPHLPDAARGYRYDDPAFGIQWPAPVVRISARDAAYPLIGAL